MKRYTEFQIMALLASIIYLQVHMLYLADFADVSRLIVYVFGILTLLTIAVAEYEFGRTIYSEVIQ